MSNVRSFFLDSATPLLISEQLLGCITWQDNRRYWELTYDFQNNKSLAALKLSAKKKLMCRPM